MLFLRFVLAVLPILWLVIALSVLKIAGHKACVAALLLTAVLAVFYWKLSVVNTLTAGLEGVLNALWPICLVIVAALFTYNLTLETGAMEAINGWTKEELFTDFKITESDNVLKSIGEYVIFFNNEFHNF